MIDWVHVVRGGAWHEVLRLLWGALCGGKAEFLVIWHRVGARQGGELCCT